MAASRRAGGDVTGCSGSQASPSQRQVSPNVVSKARPPNKIGCPSGPGAAAASRRASGARSSCRPVSISMRHCDAQPSWLSPAPASHCSPTTVSTYSLPHVSLETQSLEHPSPEIWLWSSHSSSPSSTPSPQRPGWQSRRHVASGAAELASPSSHCSPLAASTKPLPQRGATQRPPRHEPASTPGIEQVSPSPASAQAATCSSVTQLPAGPQRKPVGHNVPSGHGMAFGSRHPTASTAAQPAPRARILIPTILPRNAGPEVRSTSCCEVQG
jgi:hypothetical protein